MQLEILKRDKLDYVFQSLSFIAMVPVLCLQPVKNWAISSFPFTSDFYNGKSGLIVQILMVILTLVCYILTRKLKDTGNIKEEYKDPNQSWQMKLYKNPMFKKIVDWFIPKNKTKEYRKTIKLLKEAASREKIETLYVNKIFIAITTFIVSILFFIQLHNIAVDYIYTQPTSEYNILGTMSEREEKTAIDITAQDNKILERYVGKTNVTKEMIKVNLSIENQSEQKEEEIEKTAERIYGKLQIINSEYMKWFEILLAFVFSIIGFMIPHLMLKFQKIIRQLEIENEVMQFQTIILMLMKIERVNVEIILEWLERYSNIFKEPITKCVNNYESRCMGSIRRIEK